MTRSIPVIAALLLVSLGSTGAAVAKPAIVNGELTPATAKLPSSPKSGSAEVMAMNLDTGAYGDAANVGRNGRSSLTLPAGPWALRTSTVTAQAYSSFLSAAIVTKPGEHRTLPLTLRKFKHPRKRKHRPHHPHHHR